LNKDNNIFIFLGPPGSGKGTVSQELVDRYGWIQLSTGNLCRQHISEQTEIGKKIDFAIKSGKLISDDLIISMVHSWLDEHVKHGTFIILDGFPRTEAQAKELHNLLSTEAFSKCALHIVKFMIDDETLIDRLSSRYICENKECQAVYSLQKDSPFRPQVNLTCDICSSDLVQRPDDNKESVEQRLAVYHKHEQELVDFYEDKNKDIHTIQVDRPVKDIVKDILELI
jgi:adenylate kinase